MRGAIILQSYCNHIEFGWTDNFSFSLREEKRVRVYLRSDRVDSCGELLLGIRVEFRVEISWKLVDFLESVHRRSKGVSFGRPRVIYL